MSSDISKLFENYGKKEKFFTRYKPLVNFLQKINFDDKSHYQLLSADAYANSNFIDDGVDYFDNLYGFKLNNARFIYKLFIPYIMEKMIVLTNERGREPLFLQNNMSKIFNSFNELNNFSKSDETFSLSKFMFMMSYEQMYVQEKNYIKDMLRLKNLYKDSIEVDDLCKEKFGLSFKKLIFLHWVLFAYIISHKKTTVYFSISEFKAPFTVNNEFITTNEIDTFL